MISAEEIGYLQALQSVQSIRIENIFRREIDQQEVARYHVPPLLIPSLRTFVCIHRYYYF